MNFPVIWLFFLVISPRFSVIRLFFLVISPRFSVIRLFFLVIQMQFTENAGRKRPVRALVLEKQIEKGFCG
ncbi:hypothetical protein [Methanosarcina sp. KYL-1]|uniref:hypothetical protein n=1 Tax=Methanosarcina sp. KYL-1 TaxID=2602068 RepID=UPI0021011605|nr:hypothetical protein [Methanosarcina sp. KYL-1]